MNSVARRLTWLFLLLPLLAFGLSRLRFDVEVLHLLPGDVPAVHGLLLHQRHFAQAHQLLITLQGNDPDTVADAARAMADSLDARTNLVRSAWWQPPWLERPDEMAQVLAWLWLNQPPDHFTRLETRLESAQLDTTLREARDALATSLSPADILRLSRDPFGLSQLSGASSAPGFDQGEGVFTSLDGTFRVVQVEALNAAMNYRQAAAWLAEVRTVVAEAVAGSAQGRPTPVRVQFTGGPAFVSEISSGMQRDMTSSAITTLVVIAILFWLAHRSWRPLAWLIVMLLLTLAGTMAIGGLLYGALNVVSLGFAAVMLGLVVDYGLITYQEAVATPGVGTQELRRELTPAIGWSAFTTAAAFASLNLAGLPGLGQLGTLVAIGLGLGAIVMLFLFLPLVVRRLARRSQPTEPTPSTVTERSGGRGEGRDEGLVGRFSLTRPALVATLVIAGVILGAFLWRGVPRLTASSEPLRPRRSEAYAALQELERRLSQDHHPALLVVEGRDAADVGARLEAASRVLAEARGRGEVGESRLPAEFFPLSTRWASNLSTARTLAANSGRIRSQAVAAGFASESLSLADGTFAFWDSLAAASNRPAAKFPDFIRTNRTARWLVGQVAAETPSGAVARGMIEPTPQANLLDLSRQLAATGTYLADFDRLGESLLDRVRRRVGWLSAIIGIVLLGSLWLAFRRWVEVALGFSALGVSFLLLLAFMAVVGWRWNLMSLVALPVWLGSSVDSMIHVQLGLRRHRGRLDELWRTTGRALLLCAGANLAGFGSLAFSSNAGLASLDLVCAAGVACVFVVSMGVLPAWWRAATPDPNAAIRVEPPRRASRLYRPLPWKLGLTLTRLLPAGWIRWLCQVGAVLYRSVARDRFRIVVENLLPLCDGDPARAEAAARRLFSHFARKLADLWRYESGIGVEGLVREGGGWEHLAAAAKTGRGVLLVTTHLGNWEFGAPLLAKHGLRPIVLTAAEPGRGFTELRQQVRVGHEIETIVVGEDPFAFVEVIQRLNAGGTVALLLDRPPATHAVTVELFGRTFHAAMAAAELARATGCVILPVILPYDGERYVAQALPPIHYQPAALGNREARREFTGRILRAFEPSLRQHPDQWYHFVPVWPAEEP